MTGRALQVLALAATWLLLLDSVDPVDVLLGLLAGVAVAAVPRPGRPLDAGEASALRRLVAFPRFAVAVLWDVATGTWDVTLRVLGVRPVDRPGLVEVPFEERTEVGVAVSALATTLSPGSVLVEVDEERRTMVLHVIDASDPGRVRADHRRFYERAQRRAFP